MADLYIPPKPAIIRATELPRSPAEVRGIALREAFGPAPVFMTTGAMGGRGNPFALLAADEKSLVSTSAITIEDIDFGGGGNIAFAFNWGSNEAAINNTVTINGESATIVADVADGASRSGNQFIAFASDVPGGLGDIVVGLNTSRSYTGLYGVYQLGNRVFSNGDVFDSTATSASASVNVSKGGVVIAIHHSNVASDGAVFNSGVGQDFKGVVKAGGSMTDRTGMVGSALYAAAATPASVTTTADGNTVRRMAIASFNPS